MFIYDSRPIRLVTMKKHFIIIALFGIFLVSSVAYASHAAGNGLPTACNYYENDPVCDDTKAACGDQYLKDVSYEACKECTIKVGGKYMYGKCPGSTNGTNTSALPNLVIRNFSYEVKESAFEGKGAMNIRATIKNIGLGDANGQFYIKEQTSGGYGYADGFRASDPVFRENESKILKSGETKDVLISGSYLFPKNTDIQITATITADGGDISGSNSNLIAEDNENDNSLAKVINFRLDSTQGASVKVVSPNGGESLAIGSTHTIKWERSGTFLSTAVQKIRLIKSEGSSQTVYPIYTFPAGNSETAYSWQVGKASDGSNIPAGSNYKVQIVITEGSSVGSATLALDESDNVFSLTSGTTTNQPPVLTISSLPSSSPVNKEFTISGLATDADGTIASITWSGDAGCTVTLDAPVFSGNTAARDAKVTCSQTGKKYFTLAATDNKGATAYKDVGVEISAAVNMPPYVSIYKLFPSGNPQVGQIFTIFASANDPDGVASLVVNWSSDMCNYVAASQSSNTTSITQTWNLSCSKTGTSDTSAHAKDTKGAEATAHYLLTVAANQTNATCIDTDGGDNIYTKGTATGKEIGTDKVISKTDYCSDNNNVVEYFCNDIYAGYTPGYVNNGVKSCPNGCNNGACIEKNKYEFVYDKKYYNPSEVVTIKITSYQNNDNQLSILRISDKDYPLNLIQCTNSICTYKTSLNAPTVEGSYFFGFKLVDKSGIVKFEGTMPTLWVVNLEIAKKYVIIDNIDTYELNTFGPQRGGSTTSGIHDQYGADYVGNQQEQIVLIDIMKSKEEAKGIVDGSIDYFNKNPYVYGPKVRIETKEINGNNVYAIYLNENMINVIWTHEKLAVNIFVPSSDNLQYGVSSKILFAYLNKHTSDLMGQSIQYVKLGQKFDLKQSDSAQVTDYKNMTLKMIRIYTGSYNSIYIVNVSMPPECNGNTCSAQPPGTLYFYETNQPQTAFDAAITMLATNGNSGATFVVDSKTAGTSIAVLNVSTDKKFYGLGDTAKITALLKSSDGKFGNVTANITTPSGKRQAAEMKKDACSASTQPPTSSGVFSTSSGTITSEPPGGPPPPPGEVQCYYTAKFTGTNEEGNYYVTVKSDLQSGGYYDYPQYVYIFNVLDFKKAANYIILNDIGKNVLEDAVFTDYSSYYTSGLSNSYGYMSAYSAEYSNGNVRTGAVAIIFRDAQAVRDFINNEITSKYKIQKVTIDGNLVYVLVDDGYEKLTLWTKDNLIIAMAVDYNLQTGIRIDSTTVQNTAAQKLGITGLAAAPNPQPTTPPQPEQPEIPREIISAYLKKHPSDLQGENTYVLKLKKGWNMFSTPVYENPAEGVTPFAKFETTCTYKSPVWLYWAGSYMKANNITASKLGYWVKAQDDCSVTVKGDGLHAQETYFESDVGLNKGWNLIGAAPEEVAFAKIKGTCTFTKGPYWYNPATNAYEQPALMQPGKAYLINVPDYCKLKLEEEAPPPPPDLAATGATSLGRGW